MPYQPPLHVTQHWHVAKPAATGRRGMVVSQSRDAALAGVGITTLRQPTWQIGYAALERLIARIDGSAGPAAEQVFSGELVVRGSSQPLA